MKLCIIVLLAIIAVISADHQLNLSEEHRAHVHEVATACIEKEGVTKEAVKTLRSGQFDNADQKLQCFANCFLEKIGLFENGVVKPDAVLTKLGPLVGDDKIKAIAEKCDSVKGADNCETALKVYQCYYDNHAGL